MFITVNHYAFLIACELSCPILVSERNQKKLLLLVFYCSAPCSGWPAYAGLWIGQHLNHGGQKRVARDFKLR